MRCRVSSVEDMFGKQDKVSVDEGCKVTVTGKIIRFDEIRGYGFISPDQGGEDVFLHVNDLEIEKPLARPGTRVSFSIEEGERGQFATSVRLANNAPNAVTRNDPADDTTAVGDDYYDVLSVKEFHHTVTEMLLHLSRPLAGDQIIQARASLEQLARKHGWIEP
jgi:cold shock protein